MRGRFNFIVLTNPNLRELQATLARPIKILHFLECTAFSEDRCFRGEGGLTAHDLVDLFERLRSPSLIVLNEQKVRQLTQGHSLSHLAARVARAGAPAVLAMHLSKEPAGEFLQMFYESLASGKSIERAVWLARHRLAVHEQGEPWSNPTLYLQKESWQRGMFSWLNRALTSVGRQRRSAVGEGAGSSDAKLD